MKNRLSLLVAVPFCIITLASAILLFTNMSFIKTVGYQLMYGYSENKTASAGIKARISGVTGNIDKAVSDYIGFKTKYIELYGSFQKFIGSKYVRTGSREIVRLSNGSVYEYVSEPFASTAVRHADEIAKLKESLDQRNTPLLFSLAPCKLDKYTASLPYGMTDFSNSAADSFVSRLKEKNVSVFDLREWFHENNLFVPDCFFKSDDHWKSEYALKSWQAVTEKLNDNFGFGLDASFFSEERNEFKVYKNNFLGAAGRVIGKGYAGLDDITLITPKFDTDFHLTNSRLGYDKTGTLEETTINKSALVYNDYYNSSALDLYYARDSRIKNNLSTSGVRAVFVRDSFGGMLGGAAALAFDEISIVDMRTIGDKKLLDIIDEFNPDVVVFMYNVNMLGNSEMFSF